MSPVPVAGGLDQWPDEYVRLHAMLTTHFMYHYKCTGWDPTELADIVLERLRQKVSKGIAPTPEERRKLALAIARNVVWEVWRKPKPIPFDENLARPTYPDSSESHEDCLRRSIERLKKAEWDLLRDYYRVGANDSGGLHNHRLMQAERLGIGEDALRQQAHRAKRKAHEFYERCIGKKIR